MFLFYKVMKKYIERIFEKNLYYIEIVGFYELQKVTEKLVRNSIGPQHNWSSIFNKIHL